MDCASCGTPLRPTDHFCRKCGTRRRSAVAHPRGPQPRQDYVRGLRRRDPGRQARLRDPAAPPAAAPPSRRRRSATSRPPPRRAASALVRGHRCTADGQLLQRVRCAHLPAVDAGPHCAACGTALPPDAAFCGVCGTAVPGGSATPCRHRLPMPDQPAKAAGSRATRLDRHHRRGRRRSRGVAGAVAAVVLRESSSRSRSRPVSSRRSPRSGPTSPRSNSPSTTPSATSGPSRASGDKGATLAAATAIRIDAARQGWQPDPALSSTDAQTELQSTTTRLPRRPPPRRRCSRRSRRTRPSSRAVVNLPTNALDLSQGTSARRARRPPAAETRLQHSRRQVPDACSEPYKLPGDIMLTGNSTVPAEADRHSAWARSVMFVGLPQATSTRCSLKRVRVSRTSATAIEPRRRSRASSADEPETPSRYAGLDYLSSATQPQQCSRRSTASRSRTMRAP